jgi:Holliday junction resolvase RusA-like endonuclease
MSIKLTPELRKSLEANGIRIPERAPSRARGRAFREVIPIDADTERTPGRVICEGTVPGRAIPWKSPVTNRDGGVVHNRAYKAYKAWQAHVALHARIAMGRRKPYGGPFRAEVTYYLRPNGRTAPDTVNLHKCFLDATQGIVIVNDIEEMQVQAEKVMTSTEPERVEFRVIAL